METLTVRPTYNLNDLPLSKESLQTVSSNIWQKRRKVRNLHKIVLDFSLSNSGSILANNSFGNINFANNKNDQENSTSRNSIFGTIYKGDNQIAENRANIECKSVTKGSQGVKRLRLTPEKKEIRKEAKLAKRNTVKLETAEKKRLEKEIKKTKTLIKKV